MGGARRRAGLSLVSSLILLMGKKSGESSLVP